MKNEITIRPASASDAPRIAELLLSIAELHAKICPDIFILGNTAKYDEAAVIDLINDENNVIFAAAAEDTVVGYSIAQLKTSPKNPIMRERSIYYIDDLCVDERYQHRGIGRALMDACITDARARGCDAVELNVWENNESAKRFYESYGMKTQRRQLEMKL